MKIKTIYFAGIAAVCLLVFTACATINEEHVYTSFNGEFRLIGIRDDDIGKWMPSGHDFDGMIKFNGANHAEEKTIFYFVEDADDGVYELNYEYELNNGKIRIRFLSVWDDWQEWLNYNFDNDILELEVQPNTNVYLVYKKI